METTDTTKNVGTTGAIDPRDADGETSALELTVEKHRTWLWHGLDRATATVYRWIIRSAPGRLMTSYHRTDTALLRGEERTGYACRPVSRSKRRVVQAAEGSRIMTGMGLVWRALADNPVRMYGLFLLMYGIISVLLQAVGPLVWDRIVPDMERLILCGGIAVSAVPLALSNRSLAGVMGAGAAGHRLFCDLLGIPPERLEQPRRPARPAVLYLAVFLGIPAAVVTLWIHPLWIPLALVGVGVVGITVTHPEAGVVLASAVLPVVWLWDGCVPYLTGLILLTWLGYLLKLLRQHRTFRFGRLDVSLMLTCLLFVGGGLISVHPTFSDAYACVTMAVLASYCLLVVNLMADRAVIRRCMIGAGLSVVLIVLSGYVSLIPTDALDFLGNSRGGTFIRQEITAALQAFGRGWNVEREIFLALMCPWLAAFLPYGRRPFFKILAFGLLCLDVGLLIDAGSTYMLLCVAASLLLFCLMYSHRSLTVGILAAPAVVSGLWWYSWFRPLAGVLASAEETLTAQTKYGTRLWSGIWRMIARHPAGVGVGKEAFADVYAAYAEPGMVAVQSAGNLYLDLLVSLGWPGVIVTMLTVFLFVQKCLSALALAGRREERAALAGGVAMVATLLLLGVFYGLSLSPQLCFTVCLMTSLSSATATVVFDDRSVLVAQAVGSPSGDDRIYRIGQ